MAGTEVTVHMQETVVEKINRAALGKNIDRIAWITLVVLAVAKHLS